MQSHAPQYPPQDPQRESVRYAAQLRVRFGLDGLDREAPVANISEGGMCVETAPSMPAWMKDDEQWQRALDAQD